MTQTSTSSSDLVLSGVSDPGTVRRYAGLYRAGQWVSPNSPAVISSVNPATEDVCVEIPRGDATDVARAAEAARQALDGPWASTSPAQRGLMLTRLADLLAANTRPLAEIETMENGKPIRDTIGEMGRSVAWLRYFGGHADGTRGSTVPLGPTTFAYTRREPVGVVGAILPWNSPLLLTMWKLAPALATGNTLVLKPSELTSASLLEFVKLIELAGFPPGVVNVVTGLGPEVGSALVDSDDIDKIAFTGEYTTAREIMRGAAGSLKRCTFECGGKSPLIVFDDADLERTLRILVHSSFRSTGQSCSLASRIFVQRPVYDEVCREVADRAKRIRVGDPLAPNTHIGPQTSLAQREKSLNYIAYAEEQGMRRLCGGGTPAGLTRGYYVEPTVYADVEHSSRLAQEEIFGPVLAMIPFETEKDAVALANDSRYGLVGGLFTRDLTRAHRVSAALRCGLVSVNTFRPIHAELPYGGFKLSGLGRENGLEVLNEYTEVKSVVIDLDETVPPDPFGD